MAVMSIGAMRHRITIQAQGDAFWEGGVEVTETAGEVARGPWNNVSGGTVWAKLEPLSSSERRQALHAELQTSHRCTIRYKNFPLASALTPERLSMYRVLYQDNTLARYFAIDGVRNIDERREWWEMTLFEITGQDVTV